MSILRLLTGCALSSPDGSSSSERVINCRSALDPLDVVVFVGVLEAYALSSSALGMPVPKILAPIRSMVVVVAQKKAMKVQMVYVAKARQDRAALMGGACVWRWRWRWRYRRTDSGGDVLDKRVQARRRARRENKDTREALQPWFEFTRRSAS